MPMVTCKTHGIQFGILVCEHLTREVHAGKTEFTYERVYNEELWQEYYLCKDCLQDYNANLVAKKEHPAQDIAISVVCLECAKQQNLTT